MNERAEELERTKRNLRLGLIVLSQLIILIITVMVVILGPYLVVAQLLFDLWKSTSS